MRCPPISKVPGRLIAVSGGAAVLLVMLWISGIGVRAFLRELNSVRTKRFRVSCYNNLNGIALALRTYYQTYSAYPPQYTVDRLGRKLHSWRVLILPELGYESLYSQIKLNEAWNSPTNRRLAACMPDEYRCPADTSSERSVTNYVAVVGANAVWQRDGIPGGIVKWGSDPTALVVETSNSAIDWMEPRDMTSGEASAGINATQRCCISSRHGEGAFYLSASLSVVWLADETPLESVESLLTRQATGSENTPSAKRMTKEGSDKDKRIGLPPSNGGVPHQQKPTNQAEPQPTKPN